MRNAFITEGAEVWKRSIFLLWRPAPPNSFGVISRNALTYVVQPGAAGISDPTTLEPGIVTLLPPSPVTFSRLADWDLFNGEFYIVMQGSDGNFYHYYNQAPVTDAMATSATIRTYGGKVYGVGGVGANGRLLRFSAINNPTLWTPASDPTLGQGQGYVDLSSYDADSTDLVGLEVYYNQMAIFSTFSTQFWQLHSDPTTNQFVQLLRSTGLLGANAMSQYGSGDVMYVSPHGVRSLRVQNISLTAGTTDVGTPIDQEFRDLMIANGPAWFQDARCLIQPRTGRMFVQLPDRLYVLSTYQEPAITAWAKFDAPFNFTGSCIADPYIMLRGSDNNIYQYGGDLLQTYDATEAEVITPALSCDSPSTFKTFHSFDVGAEGTWTLSVGCDPNNQATEEVVATFTGATYMEPEMTMPETGTHISLRLRTTDTASPRLGNVMIMFDDGART